MKPETFERFSHFIQNEFGIKMGPKKQVMLQARLMKRLRQLRMSGYDEYCDYLFSPDGLIHELPFFVHQVTTNKTDFFREPAHFKFLQEEGLPNLARESSLRHRPLRIWSTASSTGEEPYTLAMVTAEYMNQHAGIDFSVLGTDISPTVLEQAAQGIFHEDRIHPVPLPLRKKYLLRAKDRTRQLVRIVPELRSKVHFRWLNLKVGPYNIQEMMDVIFCRNVIIYFNRATQENVLSQIVRHLFPGGYIFMGHSETLNGFNLPLKQVATTIYRKT